MKKTKLTIKCALILGVTLQHIPNTAGADSAYVAIRSNRAREADFRAWVSSHPDHLPLSQYWLRKFPGLDRKEDLLAQFEKARTEELDGNTSYATSLYQNIRNQFFEEPWATDTILVFQRTFASLATLVPSDRTDNLQWFFKCGGRSNDLPPALRAEAQRIQSLEAIHSIRFNTLNLRLISATHLILNGRVWNLQQRSDLTLPPGRNQVTLVGDHFLPITKIMLQTELPQWRPKPRSLSDDDCADSGWPRELRDLKGTLFVDFRCTPTNRIQDANATTQLDLNPAPQIRSWDQGGHPIESESQPIYKNPLVWIGVAVLTGVVLASQKKKSEPQVEVVRIARP